MACRRMGQRLEDGRLQRGQRLHHPTPPDDSFRPVILQLKNLADKHAPPVPARPRDARPPATTPDSYYLHSSTPQFRRSIMRSTTICWSPSRAARRGWTTASGPWWTHRPPCSPGSSVATTCSSLPIRTPLSQRQAASGKAEAGTYLSAMTFASPIASATRPTDTACRSKANLSPATHPVWRVYLRAFPPHCQMTGGPFSTVLRAE